MCLTEPLTGAARPEPEVGVRCNAEADDLAKVQQASAAERGEHDVVEGGAVRHIRALDGEMVTPVGAALGSVNCSGFSRGPGQACGFTSTLPKRARDCRGAAAPSASVIRYVESMMGCTPP